MTFDKEFKEALSRLPDKEKDKLLFRLLKKDLVLANKLHFELVNTNTIDQQRELVEAHVRDRVASFSEHFYSPGYLNMDIRYLSGDITHHVKITKDRYGDVSLNLLLLNEVMKHNAVRFNNMNTAKYKKIKVALLARTFKVLVGIQKLEQDYWMDFEEGLKALGKAYVNNESIMQLCMFHGLDVNWLLTGEIPEDIEGIHKSLKSKGYLKYSHLHYRREEWR